MSLAHLAQGLTQDPKTGLWVSSALDTPSAYTAADHMRYLKLEDQSFWFQHRNQCILAVLHQFPPQGTVLDIGGGNGYVTRGLCDAGFAATLLEPGMTGAYNGLQQRHLPEVICATLEQARFPDASLAAVGCFDVIEHLADATHFVAEIHRVLQPGGFGYVTLPAYPWLWSRNDVEVGRHRRYTRTSAHRLFQQYFTVRYSGYFFSLLVLPIFVLRSIPYRLGVTRTKALLSDQTEHGIAGGLKLKLLQYILRRELHAIQQGKNLSYGSSLLLVIEKPLA